MEKRTLLALALILLVLILSNRLLYPPVPPEEGTETGDTTEVVPDTGGEQVVRPVEGEPPSLEEAFGGTEGEEKLPEAETVAADAGTTVVETDLFRLVFSNRGAVLIGARLNEYEYFPEDEPLQLIRPQRSDFLSFFLSVKKDTLSLRGVPFTSDTRSLVLDPGRPEGSIVFSTVIGTADTITMSYTFQHDSYLFGAQLDLPEMPRVADGVKVHTLLGPTFHPTEKDSAKDDFPNFGAVFMREGEVEEKKMGKFEKGEREFVPGPLPWVVMKNKYFMVGLVSRIVPYDGAVFSGLKEQNRFMVKPNTAIPPGTRTLAYEVYVGPQDYRYLKEVGLGLEKMVEYGWFIIKPFTKLILIIMLWMHKFIENYGLVIIIFSIFTKILFYPLTKKSLQATRDMQKLQPHIKKIREEHKSDPKKLQEETMRLYREHKVNPLGGCLPLLIQMPVLWALFYVFQRTIEFRGEKFTLWIQDLSAPDPLFILPVVMGLSMYVQQKMTPTTDPRMAPMQFIMPVVLTIIFINFPAGLVLYWTVNNIMSILQQYSLKRQDTPVTKAGEKTGKGDRKNDRGRKSS